MTASEQQATGPKTAAVRITLDSVIDPAPPGSGPDAPLVGSRNIELRVTIANDGDVTVPVVEGDPYILSIEWALDPDIDNRDGVPTFAYEGLPSATCTGPEMNNFPQPGITPGESVTGCLPYQLSDATTVHSATALLLYAGTSNGAPGEWLIP